MTNHLALDPKRSIVVEACAGSGKTWLLVSRIIRLLLDGAQPSQILAITFTRKAAQEMQARLQLWLRELANAPDDATVRLFFAERGLDELSDEQIEHARGLYATVLLAQPGITISTFHGWFMQVIQRAPLNADVMQGMSLLERPGAEQEEAWEELLEQMRKQPESELAQHMQWLFAECGLFNTRKLLSNFIGKRAEWWAYTEHVSRSAMRPSPLAPLPEGEGNLPPPPSGEGWGEGTPVQFALNNLRRDLAVDLDVDALEDWGMCGNSEEVFFAFVLQYANGGTPTQKQKASELEQAWSDTEEARRFQAVWKLMFTQAGEPRKLKPTKSQNEAAFMATLNALHASLQAAQDWHAEQRAYRLNEAVLHCGAALLDRYQALKQQKQQMDFSDLEWQLCRLLQQSEHAETMQYKLDSRYRHVLLDEFQDTNPLQWQIMRAWFDAAAAVQSQPTVFLVGDPKQSIYRFRRADARLFGEAREYLKEHFGAQELHNNHTRRNAPPIVAAVNAVFREQPEGFEFAEHGTHQHDLPGHVLVLPLAVVQEDDHSPSPSGGGVGVGEPSRELALRDPLTTPRAEDGEGARHKEAQQFAEQLRTIVAEWSVREDGSERRAAWGDIMVLVRSRTHLAVYEEALRAKHIPFISSRRGGLLDTLEAEDVQALLMFLITPFADLALAQVLRTPVFACGDADLLQLSGYGIQDTVGAAGSPESRILNPVSWWQRLQQLEAPSPALQRAAELLKNWLALADKLPVHDLLDRIYFEGDVIARYGAVLPPERRAKVVANLHAFMEIALSVDAGRYPSLPRFLQELRELRESADDAPDEGKLGTAGDAVRIYTVHESKGLEAPIVWLLDANSEKNPRDNNDVLLDWPPTEERPAHFSVFTDLASRGRKRAPLFEQDAAQQAREEMNLLYVAMTRAQQALVVSGSKTSRESRAPTWYERIAAAVGEQRNSPLLSNDTEIRAPFALSPSTELRTGLSKGEQEVRDASGRASTGSARTAVLPAITPTGKRAPRNTAQQQRGIWLHALLQHLTAPSPSIPLPPAGEGSALARERDEAQLAELQQRLAIPAEEGEALWRQAQHLLALPQLSRFFDAAQYRAAWNEMPYVDAQGGLRRIDRLVEFDDEVWVLDYKLGDPEEAGRYRKQMQEYRAAMQAAYAGKKIKCALLFAGGMLTEIE